MGDRFIVWIKIWDKISFSDMIAFELPTWYYIKDMKHISFSNDYTYITLFGKNKKTETSCFYDVIFVAKTLSTTYKAPSISWGGTRQTNGNRKRKRGNYRKEIKIITKGEQNWYINPGCYALDRWLCKKKPRMGMLSLLELVTMVSQGLLRIIVLINAKLLMHKN